MELHHKDEAALQRAVEALHQTHRAALLAVLLTGEAAGAGYVSRRSPLSLLVVLERVTPAALRGSHRHLRSWRRRRIGAPLFLDPLYIDTALDVFPLEFLDLADRHRLLWGKADPLASLEIHEDHLRLEVEEQLRGKMLHLWEAYLQSSSSKRALRDILEQTAPGFQTILHGMLRLRKLPRPDLPEQLLVAVEQSFDLKLSVFHRLDLARRRRQRLPRGELQELFEAYLEEVRCLVRTVDER